MKLLRAVGRFLAEVSGERDYQRYCEHMRTCHPGKPLQSEREFYLSRLNDKYSRPSRCC